ncbi:response regulator [Paramicrobacterium chengjingii]|uniref:response regulator n=1 Tax=Paramicrobacterium chengjingii TaxID=2769067 RepID=UPI001422EF57|nr:response regulator [Microbacterium chengjingii]
MSADRELRVLVVDDEPVTAEAHADYVRRVRGYTVDAVVLTGADALARLDAAAQNGSPIDLVLLDMNLTDIHGLDVAHRIRQRGHSADILAITAVRDLQIVKAALSTGVAQYLIKPFTFPTFREKLENHRMFQLNLSDTGALATQSSIDNALSALRTVAPGKLPKGMIDETYTSVSAALRESKMSLSATELGDRLDLSRVTARRYLEYLVEMKQAAKSPRHGTPGRPEYEYRWLS